MSDEGGSTIWCVECEDVAASVRCEACGGDYMCGLCVQWQHRSGRRAQHAPTPLPGKEMFRESAQGTTQHFITLIQNEDGARALPQAWEKEEAANHKDDAGEHSNQDQLSGAFLHSKLQVSAQFILDCTKPVDDGLMDVASFVSLQPPNFLITGCSSACPLCGG